MSNEPAERTRRANLRAKAEGLIKESGHVPENLPRSDVLELIHELEVHQVELELQNEELRRAQSELQVSHKRYFDLYDLAPIGYMTLDPNGVIREINLTGADLLGTERRHLGGRTFARFVASHQRDEFYKFCRRLFESETREEVELVIARSEKEPVELLLSGIALRDAEGDLSLCQVAMIDITTRNAAESWRRKLIETGQDAVISIDRHAKIHLFNAAAEKMFGYSAAEVIGEKVNLLMPQPYAGEHDSYISSYERTGERRAIGKIREVTARRKNGEIFPIELSVTEIDRIHEPRYVAFIRDVSEKAQLQAQIVEHARLATIDDATAMVAHEIANPLNGIAISVELLERQLGRIADPTVLTTLRRIGAEISRLTRLLYDYRSLSSREVYHMRVTNLARLLEELCAIEQPKLEANGVRVEVALEPALPSVYADGEKLKQALLNLCKNAEEAMPQGGTLKVAAYQSGERVVLDVCDSGVGIPKDFNLFEPFKTTKVSGTGLGLIITRRIVSQHQGSLTYTSEPGKGTTFFVSLPIYSGFERSAPIPYE